jgi:hypothetical protein
MRHENQHWNDIRATVEIVIAGVAQTGLSPTVKIYRQSDGQWWNGSAWGGTATQLAMTEVDATDLAGYYDYQLTGGLAYSTFGVSVEGYTLYVEESTNNLVEIIRVVPLNQPAFDQSRSGIVAGSYGEYLQNPVESLAATADAVWDEPLAGHTTAGTAGKALSDTSSLPTAADVADAVWDESAGDHTAVGTTGAVLNNLPTAADTADAVWTETLADHSGTAGSTAEALAAASSGLTPAVIASAVWDAVGSDYATPLSMGYLANVTAGLLQHNHRFKSPNYDANGRLLDVVLSLFHNSTDADNDSGAFASITLEFTYDGDGNLATILGKD